MKLFVTILLLCFTLICNAQTITISNPCKKITAPVNCPYGIITAAKTVIISSNFRSASITKVGSVDSAIVITWTIQGTLSTVTIPKGSPKGTMQVFANTNFLPYASNINIATHSDSVSIQVIY